MNQSHQRVGERIVHALRHNLPCFIDMTQGLRLKGYLVLLSCLLVNQSKLPPPKLSSSLRVKSSQYVPKDKLQVGFTSSIAFTIHLQRRLVLVASRSTNPNLPNFLLHATCLPTYPSACKLNSIGPQVITIVLLVLLSILLESLRH